MGIMFPGSPALSEPENEGLRFKVGPPALLSGTAKGTSP